MAAVFVFEFAAVVSSEPAFSIVEVALNRDGGAGCSAVLLANKVDTSLLRLGGYTTEFFFSIIDTLLVNPGGFRVVASVGN